MNIEEYVKAEKNKRKIIEMITKTIQEQFIRSKEFAFNLFNFPLIKEFLSEERTEKERKAFKEKVDSIFLNGNGDVQIVAYNKTVHHLHLTDALQRIQLNQNFDFTMDRYILNSLFENRYVKMTYDKGKFFLVENFDWYLSLDDDGMTRIRKEIEQQGDSIISYFQRNFSVIMQIQILKELESLLAEHSDE